MSSNSLAGQAGAPACQLGWRPAQVREIISETSHVRSLLVCVEEWPGHLPGQYVEVRAAYDGAPQPHRSYSIASAPGDRLLALTVERIGDGRVSSYLVDQLRRGDYFELRGPIGTSFVCAASGRPLTLLAGGLGIVPLMAILRHRRRSHSTTRAALVYSCRSVEHIVYRRELDMMARRDTLLRVNYTLTRRYPPEWTGHTGRIGKVLLAETCFSSEHNPQHFVCGPKPFVEEASRLLLDLGHAPCSIKTELFVTESTAAPGVPRSSTELSLDTTPVASSSGG